MNQKDGEIIIHGHRGCRGLWPENTLKSFTEAVDMGVDFIELDIVMTADDDMLVSHEPYMHHNICRKPDGSPITDEEDDSLNIFHMTTAEASKYLCGTFIHPGFPQQQLFESCKPTLKDAVISVHGYATSKNKKLPGWNIELKSEPGWDHVYQPEPRVFVEKFLHQFRLLNISEQSIIQSFDARILEEFHLQAPDLKLVYLSGDPAKTIEQKLAELSFTPYGYSAHYSLVQEDMMSLCALRNIRLIVWTVNENADIEYMLQLGVKEIITDYPDRVKELVKKYANAS